MTIIVEDGTGKADAESFVSVADADTYHSNRGNATWATLTTDEKEQALRRATDYVGQVYRQRWKGVRVTGTQALDWPRAYVERDDVSYLSVTGQTVINGYYYFPSDEVPIMVINASAELALKAAAGELAPDLEQRVKREKVDVIETEYDQYSPQYTKYRAIDNLLSPLLKGTGMGATVALVRA